MATECLLKICTKCKQEKDIFNFNKRNDLYRAQCKNCYNRQRRSVYVSRNKGKKIGWNKGRKMPLEFGIKISFAKKGKPHKQETIDNITLAAKMRSRSSSRHSWRYKEWRQKVFERDNFNCQECGCNDVKVLHPHHIFSFHKNVDLRLDINNGITLCKSCHAKKEGFPKGYIPWAKGRKFTTEHIQKSVITKKIRRLYANN
jgi:5-methylcytosine-specific restriction endonuclease McrA